MAREALPIRQEKIRKLFAELEQVATEEGVRYTFNQLCIVQTMKDPHKLTGRRDPDSGEPEWTLDLKDEK